MDCMDYASVLLPAGMLGGDTRTLIDQFEMQVKAVLARERDEDVPHVKALVAVVRKAFERMLARRDAFVAREALRNAAVDMTSREDQEVANDNVDDAWRGIEHVLHGATFLTDGESPGREEATKLYHDVFGATKPLAFINFRPARQWDASLPRLEKLSTPEAEAILNAVGGERYLKALRRDHATFGRAYGLLAHTRPTDERVTDTRAEHLAAQAAVREYVFKVSAQIDDEDPESVRLARFLLAPYTRLVHDLERAPRKTAKHPATPPTPVTP